MTPARFETIAFRMWQYAEPLGWDCTARDVADAIGVTHQSVGHIVKAKRWGGRLRTTAQDSQEFSAHHVAQAYGADAALHWAGIKQSAGLAE